MPTGPEAVWHLAPTASIYLLADRDRAGKALLTLAVADLAGELVAFAGRGISFSAEPPGGAARRAVVTDPEGNRITFFESPQAE